VKVMLSGLGPFSFGDRGFPQPRHRSGLLVIFSRHPLVCTQQLLEEALKVAEMRGEVRWLRPTRLPDDLVRSVLKVCPKPAILNRIGLRYSFDEMYSLIADVCAALHDPVSHAPVSSIFCQLDAEDVPHVGSCAATLAMLENAAICLSTLRKRKPPKRVKLVDDENEEEEKKRKEADVTEDTASLLEQCRVFPVVCVIQLPETVKEKRAYDRIASMYSDSIIWLDGREGVDE